MHERLEENASAISLEADEYQERVEIDGRSRKSVTEKNLSRIQEWVLIHTPLHFNEPFRGQWHRDWQTQMTFNLLERRINESTETQQFTLHFQWMFSAEQL